MSAPRDLAATQGALAQALAQFVPLAERADLSANLSAIATGNDRLSAVEQVEIYREQYWLRHRDALTEDYPALSYLLGEEAFEAFVRAYLGACPPDSYTLRDLGNRIADFAAGYDFDPTVAGAARDVARYELAFVQVFDGPDVPPVPLERVQHLPPEAWATARLAFQPLLLLLAFDHPVHELRAAVKRGDEPARRLAQKKTLLALWRGDDLKVHYLGLPEREHALLTRLRAGATLAEACGEMAERLPPEEREHFAGQLARWFRAWGERGWIVDVTAPAVAGSSLPGV